MHSDYMHLFYVTVFDSYCKGSRRFLFTGEVFPGCFGLGQLYESGISCAECPSSYPAKASGQVKY